MENALCVFVCVCVCVRVRVCVCMSSYILVGLVIIIFMILFKNNIACRLARFMSLSGGREGGREDLVTLNGYGYMVLIRVMIMVVKET